MRGMPDGLLVLDDDGLGGCVPDSHFRRDSVGESTVFDDVHDAISDGFVAGNELLEFLENLVADATARTVLEYYNRPLVGTFEEVPPVATILKDERWCGRLTASPRRQLVSDQIFQSLEDGHRTLAFFRCLRSLLYQR